MSVRERNITIWYGKLEDAPRYPDLAYWQEQPDEKKVFRAPVKYGAPVTNMSPADFMREGFFFTMGLAPSRVDILFDLTGLDFETAWERRVGARLADAETNFLSRVDLIINKEAVG